MILYLGNMLSGHGRTVSMLETLIPRLSEIAKIKAYSNQQNKLLRLLSMLAGVVRYRKDLKLVLIDTFSTDAFWFAFLCGAFCKTLRIPYVPVLRGGDFETRLKKNPRAAGFLLNHSYMNIAPSTFMKELLWQNGFESQYIPNALDIKRYSFRLRDKCRPHLLWVRSFAHIYNPVMAIEVLADLRKKYSDTKLCMVGPDKDGSLAIVKKRAAELNVLDSVVFTGVLSKEEWLRLSAEYDVFINTTNYDNLPVSLLEAMALGFPIVSTNVGGIPYLIKDHVNGLLATQGNYKEMAEKIESIISDSKKAHDLSVSARANAETFAWEGIKKIWTDLFERCSDRLV